MVNDFNLSERIMDENIPLKEKVILVKDFKKFIKYVNEELREHSKIHYHAKRTCVQVIREKINKLVGGKING